MTLAEFASLCSTPICAKSGFNGKTLCLRFNPKKHTAIGAREVLSIWADIQVSPHCQGHAQSVIIVHVDGKPECDKAMGREEIRDWVGCPAERSLHEPLV